MTLIELKNIIDILVEVHEEVPVKIENGRDGTSDLSNAIFKLKIDKSHNPPETVLVINSK